MTKHRSPSLFHSFNNAAEGIVQAVRTQRNLWVHFAVAVLVLVAAVGFGASKLELAVLLLSITFVLVAELVNTAVEAAVDVASTSFDPLAKIAKDIAAGAVLVAALNAVAVGYLVFSGEVATRSSRFLTRLSDAPAELTLVAFAVTVIIVITVKAYTGRGTPLRGGLPSGHAAVAFAGWMAVTFIADSSSHRFLISSVTFIMALLVAQTRVETGVHSTSEVASGAVLGALVTLFLFQAFGGRGRRGRLRPVLELPGRLRRAREGWARDRGRERRERRVPARRLCRADGLLACCRRGVSSG
jgi:diacylglycerol kinase (ATP)